MLVEIKPDSRGYYPLMTLGVEDVLEAARSRYGDEEANKLRPHLDAACDRVASKWDCAWDAFAVAVDWALENAQDDAEADGIVPRRPL